MSPDISNNSEHYVLEIGFVNDLGYDTISYNSDTSGTTYRENMSSTGIVVDGVAIPEPSSIVLLVIGGLALLRRRR